MKMKYKTGEFKTYRATTKFHIGDLGRDVLEDEEVEFDGVVLQFPDGDKTRMPKAKGAVLNGWLVPVEDQESTYDPKPAGVEVHSPENRGRERTPIKMATAVQEERVVGNIEERASQPKRSAQPKRKAASIQKGQISKDQIRQMMKGHDPKDAYCECQLCTYNQDVFREILDQEQETFTPSPPHFATLQSTATEGNTPKVGGGKFAVHRMDGGQQGSVVGQVHQASLGAKVGQAGDPHLKEWTGSVEKHNADSVGVRPQKGTREGIHNLEPVVSGSPDFEVPKAVVSKTGDMTVSLVTDDLSEMIPDSVVAGKVRKPKKSKEDLIQEVVEEWDTNRHWKARVKEAVEFYSESPEILEAICKIESPAVAKQIREKTQG